MVWLINSKVNGLVEGKIQMMKVFIIKMQEIWSYNKIQYINIVKL